MADTKEEKIEQPDLIKNADGDRKIIFRKNLDRPLTSAEVDTNFLIVPEIVHEAMMEVGKSIWNYQTNIQKDILENRATSKSNLKKIDKNIEDVKSLKEQITNTPKYTTLEHYKDEQIYFSFPFLKVKIPEFTDDNMTYSYTLSRLNLDILFTVSLGLVDDAVLTEFLPNIEINLSEIKEENTSICNFFNIRDEEDYLLPITLFAYKKENIVVFTMFTDEVVLDGMKISYKINNGACSVESLDGLEIKTEDF